MSKLLSAALAGLLFGLGLLLSGMSNPAKVLGFLDVTGQWDPSLMLVMGGAIAIGFFAFRRAERQTHSLLGEPMQLPDKSRLTPRLVVGSALFGIGWGLAGICPGPGLVLVGMGQAGGVYFVVAMLLGMWCARPLIKWLS
ncbi:membrane protein [Aquitalea magnusonii]|uniref:YeeE/YedE family protein n=1 Tax=Aquitalea pelogenes TaxID=1293573 RepID=UPI0005F7826A|nr:YeeE/YedE family protein [Aquitalea pelogenes]KJV32129.1 membrane protein [Aquitalea magnusonii]